MGRRLSREGFIDLSDADLAWRRLELSALRTALQRSSGVALHTASRNAVTLAYAHWEGFVVSTSRLLVEHVAGLGLVYGDLADSYAAMCLAGRLTEAEASTRRIERHIDVVSAIRRVGEVAAFPSVERLISGEGNLKSEKLRDIVARLNLDPRPFELHSVWLDSELLRRRNSIAHGQYGSADLDFAEEALNTVAELMEQFRTAAQNAVVLERFRRSD